MLDQNPDGSHSITLHQIGCPGRPLFPQSSGLLTWSRENGITFTLTFSGIDSLSGTEFYDESRLKIRGVGRFVPSPLDQPRWIAKTEDGTAVRLYGVNEVPSSQQTTGTSGFSMSCSFNGTALFAVVDIPASRLLAFDNSTEEDFRMFFVGAAGKRHHITQEVEFHGQDGSWTRTSRSSILLSDSPRVSLVSAHALVKCQPSGWLSFSQEPFTSECEIGAFPEQNFVSFLNGRKTPFFWVDRRQSSGVIRRTYFGWMKSGQQDYEHCHHQPLPIMDGIEVFQYGEIVRDLFPVLFRRFLQRSSEIDFGVILHPLWTALEGVLDDRLALASVSLERTASTWDSCRKRILSGPFPSDASFWKKKAFLRGIRRQLQTVLEKIVKNENSKPRILERARNGLISILSTLVAGEDCKSLTSSERNELYEVLKARIINNLTGMPNSARLRRPFEDLKIILSPLDQEALQKRNDALHGGGSSTGQELEQLDSGAMYFDSIRMMLTKFVLAVCNYTGPFIDYASRPANGNFEIKNMNEAILNE